CRRRPWRRARAPRRSGTGRASAAPSARPLAGALHRTEHRAPDRMPGLGRRELHGGVHGERLAELLAALALTARRAMDEGEVLVRAHLVGSRQPLIDRRGKPPGGFRVAAFLL